MPEKTPPLYRWAVSLAGDTAQTSVDAAYPLIEDAGHMVLKDADHKIVFAAAPETGCTFTRMGPVVAAPAEVTGGFPDNCECTYTAVFSPGTWAARWVRTVSRECGADHAEVDRTAVPVADSGARVQAEADKIYFDIGAVSLAQIKKLRYPDGGDADPVPA